MINRKGILKILQLLTIFYFSIHTMLGQDTTKPFSFPHKTGDMWEYFYDDYSPMYLDTVQKFIISDSVDSKGIIHITQYGRSINPIGYPILFADTAKYWIDTVNNYVWGSKGQNDSVLIYKLNATKKEQWVMETIKDSEKIYGYNIARVLDKWNGILFNKVTTFMNIEYYGSSDSTDTTGYNVEGGDVIADGFGLISKAGGELPGEVHLIGAVIDNILYGDTTLVSIKDYKSILPLSIKLNQNYPNPFNLSTTISFELPGQSYISLIIYDILGREVYRLIDNEEFNSGEHSIKWKGLKEDGCIVTSGIYFYRIIDGTFTSTKKMVVIK